MMNKLKLWALALPLLILSTAATSCLDDNDDVVAVPTALVTVRPAAEGFTMQVDENTTLVAANMDKSPFGDKEVRAIITFSEVNEKTDGAVRSVYLHSIDSIRTKMPEPTLGELDNETYGNDPIEVINDWVTVAEDGYLTLRIRTVWGFTNVKHRVSLITGTDPENPYRLVLHHDAFGDLVGTFGDGLIAFNLKDLPHQPDEEVTITLVWNSFEGKKSADFKLKFHKSAVSAPSSIAAAPYTSAID